MSDILNYKIFNVAEDKILGRHLIANREIHEGEIILHENSLIQGPSQITGPVCLACLQSLRPNNSSECKICGWPLCKDEKCHFHSNHISECDWTKNKRKNKVNIKNFTIPHRSYECISVIRCLYHKDKSDTWKKLMKLESHCDKRKGSEKYDSDRIVVAQFLYRFFKVDPEEYPEEEILKICGIIQINGHEVPLTEPPYMAIYEIASLLEHSCMPNSCKTFLQDGSLIIRATNHIKKGEHISICYTDPLWSTINRQQHLTLTKYFQCTCLRCVDPTEMKTNYSSLHCFNKKCAGFLVPNIFYNESGLPSATWKCDMCHKNENKDEVSEILKCIAQDFMLTDKQNTSSCEMFLKHYTNNRLLHTNHYFLSDIRLKLAQLYGQTSEHNVQSLSDFDLTRKIDLCQQSLQFSSNLYPAEWRIQGVLKFELHASITEHARRLMVTDQIQLDGLKTKLMESKKWLEESIFHLKYEPEILPEGKIVKQGEKNLADLESLLMRMYFKV